MISRYGGVESKSYIDVATKLANALDETPDFLLGKAEKICGTKKICGGYLQIFLLGESPINKKYFLLIIKPYSSFLVIQS